MRMNLACTWGMGCLLMFCCASSARGTVYYVSATGADNNPGDTAEQSWRTVRKVNKTSIAPGDTVLFQRGGSWREQLRPHRGNESAAVTYGAYGEGAKPALVGSVELNRPEDWIEEGTRLWSSRPPTAVGDPVLPNPDFTLEAVPWMLHYESGAKASCGRDTEVYDSAPAAYRVTCQAPGSAGSHIQFYSQQFSVEEGARYQVSFRAKSSVPVLFTFPTLMKAGPPYERYAAEPPQAAHPAEQEWRTYTYCYESLFSADDARLTFFLGTALPEGATLYLDDVRLRRCEPGAGIMSDVGNIIFDGEAFCGVKVWNREDLKEQGQYWYDEERRTVTLYSEKNPALHYTDIECALREHIIDQTNASYVIYENLALRYGAAHGIGGGTTHHIIVRDCDLSYIGGGDQMGGDKTVRYGNGIEFWGTAHDNLVERCRLWEIYDAALTNQSGGPNTPHYNITYRFNVIWNCEYSFEYWNRPEESVTHDIYFDNNTCVNAGHGWGHTQRPDPSGRHLCFYTSPAAIEAFHVRNNVFFEARGNAFYAPKWTPEQINVLVMDHNLWYQAEGMMISAASENYPMSAFSDYQRAWEKESSSLVADPVFENPAQLNFRLAAGSPCIDTGMDLGYKADYGQGIIPQGKGPDIGAFERKGV